MAGTASLRHARSARGGRPVAADRGLRVHLIVYASLATLLAVINALSTPGVPWALWPAWGLAIPLGIHAGYLSWGWPGAHIGLFGVINGGLLAIDLAYSNGFWFYWPLLGWGTGLLLTTFIVLQYRRLRPGRPRPVSTDDLDLGPAPPSQPGPAVAVDIDMRRVTVDGREVELTPKEFDLLVLLYENPGRPFNRGELLDRIWKNDYEVTERTVDACVVRLRRKLGGRAEAIQTVWGVGYRYQPPNGAPGDAPRV